MIRIRSRRADWLRAVGVGIVVGAGVLAISVTAVPPAPAQANDDSAVTVTAREQDPAWEDAPFPDLEVTVSQTEQLLAQGITVTWKGGKRSQLPDNQSGGRNFLQIAQCWGDAPGGGPDRETCQYGAALTPGATRDQARVDGSIAREDLPHSIPSDPFNSAYTSIPFKGVTGEVVDNVVDGRLVDVDINTNQFFTRFTTNEVPWAGSAADGSGTVTFELQTAVQSPGLGCGSPQGTGADITGQSCWLVIIPRGEADRGEQNIVGSGLFWDTWKHKLAVKLDFRPLGVRCPIGAAERPVAGSEVAAHAVFSWLPALCSAPGGAAYSLITGNESDALFTANLGHSDAPLALTSRPLGVAEGEADYLQYAPVALGAVSISLAIDRVPNPFGAPEDVAARARLPFTELNLTPRLLAKLLTYSYWESLPQGADLSHIGFTSTRDPGPNARNLLRDPEFLAINDAEWGFQSIFSSAVADILMPQARSDSAWAVWSYVLSDPEAAAFLAGEPDPWGMKINPYYSTDAETNPNGTAFVVPRDNFPKADPVEAAAVGDAAAVNLVSWRPYTNDLAQGAYLSLRGDGQLLGAWDPNAIPPRFARQARDLPGSRKVLALTDTASAERYQVVTAKLRNPAGQFVAPTNDGMLAAAAASTPVPTQPQVRRFDPLSSQAKTASAAYPLISPLYAAARADIQDKALSSDYAEFIRYAVGDGQETGEIEGMLPAGYAPIPESWRAQAIATAELIEKGRQPSPAPTTPPQSGGGGTAPTQTGGGGSAAAAPANPAGPAASVDQPTATGSVTGPLSGGPSSPDSDLGVFPAVAPLSALAGVAAAGVTLFASRRRIASPN